MRGLGLEPVEDSVPLGAFGRSDRGWSAAHRILVLLAQPLLGHELRIAAQQNVGAAAGHVGGNRDRALAAGLRDDERFALVILGVQHFVPDAHLLQHARQSFGLFDRNRAHQHRLALLVQLLDLLGGVAEFLFLGAVDDVLDARCAAAAGWSGITTTSRL